MARSIARSSSSRSTGAARPGRSSARSGCPGGLPLPTLVANAISQDGDALIPLAVLTGVAAVAGLPGWTVAALAPTCLAIPLAVAAAGGAGLARELLRPQRRPTRGGGLGHSPEQGERFVT
ncbi:hypothetical protein ACGFNF_06105 [Micromonospora sp. NPDC048868]|uniref:hypothetical protein n=1 Tax=Micromonospora sp. NPDC048868 TaxID=3364258 RepID=UPI003717354B